MRVINNLSEILRIMDIPAEGRFEVNFRFIQTGNVYSFIVNESDYRLTYDSGEESDYTIFYINNFFRELDIQDPCKWIEDTNTIYTVEESSFEDQRRNRLTDFPEAVKAITHHQYVRLFKSLYGELEKVNIGERILESLRIVESPKIDSIPPEGNPVKENVLNNFIPFIPNLNPTGFVLTINITS